MEENVIFVQNLTKSFNKHVALREQRACWYARFQAFTKETTFTRLCILCS